MESSNNQLPLLAKHTVDGAVDYEGRPAVRSKYGGWRSTPFVVGAYHSFTEVLDVFFFMKLIDYYVGRWYVVHFETWVLLESNLGLVVAERCAFFGVGANLISYLAGPLRQSTATAAENVNAWTGVSALLPLLGAVVSDSYLGCYRTIILSSVIYILGLGLLALSTLLPSSSSASSSQLQVFIFFFALYLVGVGQGGNRPCVQAFGADQFDARDPDERKAKSSFFNWYFFGMNVGLIFMLSILFYIQDNLSWGIAFGIPCIMMTIALVGFLLGKKSYRFSLDSGEEGPLIRIGRVFVAATRNCCASADIEEAAKGKLQYNVSQKFKFLNKALIVPDHPNGNRKMCTVSDVEKAKELLGLFPIWATCLPYAVAVQQRSTFFIKQGATMDRSLGETFVVPAASLQCFIGLSIVFFIPIYDRVFVPIARAFTGDPSGISLLQRIGAGMFMSVVSMVVAATVEHRRLEIALDRGLVDLADAIVPMRMWWLVPQYALFGIADAFTLVGLQEFFYDQVPNELRSFGLSLFMSIMGIGSLLSGILVSMIDEVTGVSGVSWFADNLNQGHLDYFYWLLALLILVALSAFIYFTKSFTYARKSAAT